MFAGGPPFEKAVPGDPYYKVLAAKNYNVFWGAHSKRKPAEFFSDSFKDLMNRMLALKAEERLDINGIKDHAWYKGEVLMLNDLNADFTERKRVIAAKKEEERGAGKRGILTDVPPKDLEEFRESLKFHESAIQKLRHVDEKDFVLNITPVDFVASLQFLLSSKINRILDTDVKELYEVIPNETSGTITIKLLHNIFEVDKEAILLIDLALNDKGHLVARFRRDEEETMDSLTFIRLTTYLRKSLNA